MTAESKNHGFLSDLTGSQDGSVRLWEWGHSQCIATARQPGQFPKVTKVKFNAQGNKVSQFLFVIINWKKIIF